MRENERLKGSSNRNETANRANQLVVRSENMGGIKLPRGWIFEESV